MVSLHDGGPGARGGPGPGGPPPANNALFSPLAVSPVYAKALNLDESYRSLADSPSTSALQLVRVNAGVVSERAASVNLNLGAGLDLRVHRVESYRTESGSLVWSGVVSDAISGIFLPEAVPFDPLNTVTLVKDGAMITGNIHYNGDWYKIRPLQVGRSRAGLRRSEGDAAGPSGGIRRSAGRT